MKKIKLNRKQLVRWFFWLALIVIWNYGYPAATPFEDVAIAAILSLFFSFL